MFLTANMWDYGTLVARMVPNRFHGRVVKRVEGREEEDTFPTEYKTNTRADVDRLAQSAGLKVEEFQYLNQYPNYFMFNGALFFIGMCFERLTTRFSGLPRSTRRQAMPTCPSCCARAWRCSGAPGDV